MTLGPNQREAAVRWYEQRPESIPVDRFEYTPRGRVRCVLCHREGFMGHVGPVPAPELIGGRVRRWNVWYPFAPWQLACLSPHDWPCSCGKSFPAYVNLWRHIGADRPNGWGRVGEHRALRVPGEA